MNLIRAGMQLMGIDDVVAAIRKDAPVLTTKVDTFIAKNKLVYYVLINTWLLIIKQYSEYGWVRVADSIRRHGLIALIKSAQATSDELIRSIPITDSLWRSICNDVSRLRFRFVPVNDGTIGVDPLATQLAVLRYPKRLSCLDNDRIQQESLNDFIAVENRSKILQRREPNYHLFQFVRDEASKYLNWEALCSAIDRCIADNSCQFTGGVGLDSSNRIGSKLKRVAKNFPEYFIEPFGLKYTGAYLDVDEPELWGKYQTDTVREVGVTAVPKSYKASRIIAIEDTTRQSRARALASVIDRFLPNTISLHDQGVNQKLAWFGSVTGAVATLDLSHASDCITKSLFCSVFPAAFVDRILPFLGTHTVINEKRRVMQQMSTAGNSLTFILESMTFDIICRASRALCDCFGQSSMKSVTIDGREYAIPSVYGDDLIVDTQVAETTVMVLEALGFIVNEAKSYYDGSYRESCGEEYMAGVNVSSVYFPRFPIEGTINDSQLKLSDRYVRDSYRDVLVDSLMSLVSLQQRLYFVSYGAARFIYELIKEAKPSMTTSTPGSLNGDCWEYESTFKERGIPCSLDGKLKYMKSLTVTVDGKPREVSLVRQLKYRPVTKYALDKPIDSFAERLFNAYRYRHFLENGPQYSEPLLEILGVSDAPLTVEQAFGTPEVQWVLMESLD